MGIAVCRKCGVEFERHGRAPFQYCEAHRVDRAEQNRRKARAHTARLREARSPVRCVVCDTEFLAKRSDAKTCSPACKKLEANRHAREAERRSKGECIDCGVAIARRSVRCAACAAKHLVDTGVRRGENNYAWKGGKSKDQFGYVHVLVAPEARKGHRYQPEHRLVWEAANGPLPKGYIVHHINGIKDDNRLENLVAASRADHTKGDKRIEHLEAEILRLKQMKKNREGYWKS